MTPDGARERMKVRGDQAGIEDLHPHRFRHTFAHDFLIERRTGARPQAAGRLVLGRDARAVRRQRCRCPGQGGRAADEARRPGVRRSLEEEPPQEPDPDWFAEQAWLEEQRRDENGWAEDDPDWLAQQEPDEIYLRHWAEGEQVAAAVRYLTEHRNDRALRPLTAARCPTGTRLLAGVYPYQGGIWLWLEGTRRRPTAGAQRVTRPPEAVLLRPATEPAHPPGCRCYLTEHRVTCTCCRADRLITIRCDDSIGVRPLPRTHTAP